MEPTAKMIKKLYVAGHELADRIDLSLRSRDFPDEVGEELRWRAVGYLWQVVRSYASLPVPARGVYVSCVRQYVAAARLVLTKSLGESQPRAGGGGAAEVPAMPDLTGDEEGLTARSLLQTEAALCASMVGLGRREVEALVESVDDVLGVFDLVREVVCS